MNADYKTIQAGMDIGVRLYYPGSCRLLDPLARPHLAALVTQTNTNPGAAMEDID